jgi:hypothetical protein
MDHPAPDPQHCVAGLLEVPLEAVENATEAKVQAVDLSKNNFNTVPEVRNGRNTNQSVQYGWLPFERKFVAYCRLPSSV